MIFRPNVAALIRYQNKYLACCRKDHGSWQTIQGGIENFDISPENALIREMEEELSIQEKDFKILYRSQYWRRYHFTRKILKDKKSTYYGQDQLWFLVEFSEQNKITLNDNHEFKTIEWLSIKEFLDRYATWKKAAVYDFCRELNCLP